jgi:biofilm PGA synthesis N-glycosyltransferase PgaC
LTRTTASPRYALVSPVKDEARHIELTLRSVTEQTIKPVLWAIVDDGSTDGTADIVRRYVEEHAFVRLFESPKAGPRNTGSAEVLAFYRGYESLRGIDFDFIVKLDGDLSFERDYFEKLLGRFSSDATLGIASGVYLESDQSGSWKPVGMPSYHAFGACKVVRRTCFDEISGFATTPGWDTADEIRAMARGWKTCHFSDLEVRHHKPEGSAMGLLKTSRMHGEIHYVTGGDPLFLLFKVLHRLTVRPFLFSALALSFGYLQAVLKRKPRLVTRHEAAVYQQLLRQRLWRVAKKPFAWVLSASGVHS